MSEFLKQFSLVFRPAERCECFAALRVHSVPVLKLLYLARMKLSRRVVGSAPYSLDAARDENCLSSPACSSLGHSGLCLLFATRH